MLILLKKPIKLYNNNYNNVVFIIKRVKRNVYFR